MITVFKRETEIRNRIYHLQLEGPFRLILH